MAVNDAVNKYMTSTTSFQPASGVEVLVLKVFTTSVGVVYGIQDGTSQAGTYMIYNVQQSAQPVKYLITNTDYFFISASNSLFGFSGIQTK